MPKKKTALTIEERLQQALVPAEEQPYEVPENWVWVRLGDVNKYISKSVNPISEPDKIFELYSVPSMVDNYPEIIAGSDIGSSKQSVCKKDVLLCKIAALRTAKLSATSCSRSFASSSLAKSSSMRSTMRCCSESGGRGMGYVCTYLGCALIKEPPTPDTLESINSLKYFD